MSKDSLWFGYLEIGDNSSPVARDPKLNTGKPDTIYLFNLKRNQIIEYKAEIVEPKLRELTKDEAVVSKELKKTFNKTVKDFTPRAKPLNIPDSAPPQPTTIKKKDEIKLEEVDIDIDDDALDDDIEDDD